MRYLTAARAGLIACHACGNVDEREAPHADRQGAPLRARAQRCSRCGAPLHQRNVDSITRTWALLIAAAILYIPANVLPVLHTSSLIGSEDSTIMSGVVYFWTSGEWPLAVIIFVASILVPMLKLGVLTLLAITAQRRSAWRPLQRAKLYRIVERIGRWSMLDVFVDAFVVALVQLQPLMSVEPGFGVVFFMSVVVLTMLAAQSFDPRLIWDTQSQREAFSG